MDGVAQDFSAAYSDSSFFEKLARQARAAGRQVVELALQLYYAAESPDTPRWARTIVYGALAYFILPLDAIPDVLPVVGYSDDLGVLTAALATIALRITPEVKQQARRKARALFGG